MRNVTFGEECGYEVALVANDDGSVGEFFRSPGAAWRSASTGEIADAQAYAQIEAAAALESFRKAIKGAEPRVVTTGMWAVTTRLASGHVHLNGLGLTAREADEAAGECGPGRSLDRVAVSVTTDRLARCHWVSGGR